MDGDELRRRRQLKGQTLQDLAETCGISVQYLSQIERGDRRRVSPPIYARICDGVGLREDDREQLLGVA